MYYKRKSPERRQPTRAYIKNIVVKQKNNREHTSRQEKNKIPVVSGSIYYNENGYKLFEFYCEHCNIDHIHGAPSPGNHHRAAHCHPEKQSPYLETGYYLETKGERT